KIMTAFEAPIMLNKQFVGLIGIDVTLDRFQEIVSAIEMNKLDGSYAFLLSHNGKYAAHPNNELLNTKAHQNPTNLENFNLFQRIELGEAFSVTHINEGDDRFVSYFPIRIGRTDTYWYLGISVPKASINKAVNENLYVSLVVGILGLIIMSIVIYIVALSITRPVQAVTGQLRNLAQGQISTKNTLNLRTGDEIQEMAEALNETIEKLNYKNVFAKRLGDGDLQYKFDIENEKDELGLSLVEMQQNLLKAREEEEKRKQEDKINQWTNKAITETSDIFRRHNKNIQELSFITIQYLLDYLDIVQGGIYVRNDDEEEPYYELASAIAFGRDKLIDCKIKEEEGLVGRCGYEKLTVSLTEIPDNYVDIKSGLGGANPNNILLVPLKSNEQVYGVVELISFKPIDDYKISLVEQVGGNLAATIANVKINEKTEKLLRQSQQQAEELARQEQEMRQNVEEMKVTQEGAQQREQEMLALHDAVNDIAYLAEFDMDGHLIEMNKNLEILLAKPKEQMIGMQQGAFGENADPEQFQTMWKQLRNGSSVTHEQRITTGSTDVWLHETYKPILNADGEPYKVINIAIDITHTKS
nr:HAMP domain-containing protein [Salinivirgaceae bacterium]